MHWKISYALVKSGSGDEVNVDVDGRILPTPKPREGFVESNHFVDENNVASRRTKAETLSQQANDLDRQTQPLTG